MQKGRRRPTNACTAEGLWGKNPERDGQSECRLSARGGSAGSETKPGSNSESSQNPLRCSCSGGSARRRCRSEPWLTKLEVEARPSQATSNQLLRTSTAGINLTGVLTVRILQDDAVQWEGHKWWESHLQEWLLLKPNKESFNSNLRWTKRNQTLKTPFVEKCFVMFERKNWEDSAGYGLFA